MKFTFDGKYDINSNVYLIYNIYDKNKSIVGSSNSAGLTVGGAQALSYTYDDNRYLMDLSGLNLSQNEFYTLEVIDTKGTKKYLKFIFKY
ncbi:MAG: hypothetical protein MK066_03885 [Crocinitomicaceae bacterium]|nr:hypothetical protein [Crocinitomicaceae bacterium]